MGRPAWATAVLLATIGVVMAIGCDGDSADSSDEASVPRVPLGVIKVPEGTPQGEWLEISGRAKRGVSEPVSVDFGHTPLLWCYRGGSRLVFEQAGPRVYLSVDDGPFSLAGIIVRSRDEMLLLNDLKAEHARLTLWIYSPHLVHLNDMSSPESVESVQLWEWGRGHLTDLSPLSRATALTSLCVGNCPNLDDLSPLAKLSHLSSLHAGGTAVDSVSDLSDLPLTWLDLRLTRLSPDSAAGLTDLDELEVLKVSARASSKDISDAIGAFAGVFGVDVGDKLTARLLSVFFGHGAAVMPWADVLPELPRLTSLTVLCSERAWGEGGSMVPLGELPKLQSLTLDAMGGDPDLSGLASLENLNVLRLAARVKRIGLDLTPLSELASLKALQIEIRDGRSLEDLLDTLGSLDLAVVGKLKALETLSVICDGETTSHESLGELPALRKLRIRSYAEIVLPEFSHPEKLRVLELAGISGFDRVGKLTDLEVLIVRESFLRNTPDLMVLVPLQKLRVLDLGHCDMPGGLNVKGIDELNQLEVLNLEGWQGGISVWVESERRHHFVDQLPLLSALKNLRELDLSRKRPGRTAPFNLKPLARLKKLSRLELDLADVKGGALPALPSLEAISLPRNITSQGLEKFAREHPNLKRLRWRGGGTLGHEPLKADLSPIRKLTNLTEIELECDDLSLMGDMHSLTNVLILPSFESWGGVLDLDTASAGNLRSLRYIEIGGTYRSLRLPPWPHLFTVWILAVPPSEVTGLSWERGANLFQPFIRATNEPPQAGSGPLEK